MNICTICDREYEYDRRKGGTTKKCNSCLVNHRRFKMKKRIIEYLGGKCQECGYNRCDQALHVHHTDPAQKEFKLSGAHCRAWAKIQKELDKCILLCANCHAEEHARDGR